MFVNCFNGYGLCLFAIPVREGIEAERLASHVYDAHDLVDDWVISDTPLGAVVRY